MIVKKGAYVYDTPTTKLKRPVIITNPQYKIFLKGEQNGKNNDNAR